MRWDRFFADLEDQLASGWEAERVALDSEAERLRLARLSLRERLSGLVDDDGSGPIAVEMPDGTVVAGGVVAAGADWVALTTADSRAMQVIVPIASICGIRMLDADLLRSARSAPARPGLSDRLTFGFVMRDLVRRRTGVTIQLVGGRMLAGTIDRAGVDHLDLAQHEQGAARRAAEVTGFRIVAFSAIAWVRIAGRAAL